MAEKNEKEMKAQSAGQPEEIEELECVEGTEEMETEQNSAEEATAQPEQTEGDTIEKMGLKLAELNDRYLRLSAEFDNYRKRTLKEKMEMTKTAGEQVLVRILPVVDNFERALASIQTAKDVEALRQGIELIYHSFEDFLAQNGVKEVPGVNSVFDTDIHEAITKIPAPSEELKGKVVDCIEKGYYLNDKVMRFAKVVVGE